MADDKKNKKVMTPKFRVSFPWVFKPQPPMEGSAAGAEAKFGISMLFDKAAQETPEFKAMKELAVAAAKEKFGEKLKPDGKGWFHGLKNPLRDGATKSDLEGYGEGVIFCNATSKMKPGVVGPSLQKLETSDDFYAGCYARATVVAYGFDKAGNKGVAFGLNNVQKLGDGDPFSGKVAADKDFDATEKPQTDAEFMS